MARTELLDDMPTSIDPYEVLEVSKMATESEIKSAYRKLALKRHPDKALPGDRKAAHAAFQSLAFAYAVLSEPKRRARYDRTGSTEESIVDDDGFDWTEYFRSQFSEVVTTERIEEMRHEYQGSEEEHKDVLDAYTKYKGNLDKVFESVLLSDVLDDEKRFRRLIERAIEGGDVTAFDKFTNETEKTREKRRKRALKEREEAELAATADSDEEGKSEQQDITTDDDEPSTSKKPAPKPKSKPNRKGSVATQANTSGKDKGRRKDKGDSMNDLAALIQQRNAGRASAAEAFFDSLEAKYAGAPRSKKGKKRQADDEPSEEAFAKMAKRGRKSK